MRALVTGGAGFIGSHLCDRLIQRGDEVCCVDDLSLGRHRNIAHLKSVATFAFHEVSVLDEDKLNELFTRTQFDGVFHLAANSDISAGTANVKIDLQLNQISTIVLLEAMKKHRVKRLFFASTSAVFGDTDALLTEEHGPLQPISYYGASKLAAEAYISVFAKTFGGQALVLRFPNVVGERATHGAIYDFLQKLRRDNSRLDVMGNGTQSKPYLYVQDLIDGIMMAWDRPAETMSVYHAAGSGETSVREIAEIVVAAAGSPRTEIVFGVGDRGWAGDVPRFRYDTTKLESIGWRSRRNSTEAVKFAVEQIVANGF